jgi:hypothetical protein
VFHAQAVNSRTGRGASRPFDSAEQAAQNLVILLRADGWTDDPEATVSRLVSGETITHKRFEYHVSEEA